MSMYIGKEKITPAMNMLVVDQKTFTIVNNRNVVEYTADDLTIEGFTKIRPYLLSYLPKLQSVVIPDTITEIGTGEFQNDIALETVILPDTITEIPEDCFRGCTSLSSVKIPSLLNSIEINAFVNCSSLHEITLPNTLDKKYPLIGEIAFGSGLQTINFKGTKAEFNEIFSTDEIKSWLKPRPTSKLTIVCTDETFTI